MVNKEKINFNEFPIMLAPIAGFSDFSLEKYVEDTELIIHLQKW
jgi:hypothetical protein